MPQVAIGAVNIAYDDQGSGAPVVFIHGHPFNRSMWHPQVAALTPHYRAITFDLRGYGQSTAPATHETFLDDFANDLAALMDNLGVPSAVIVGLSMGGQITMEFVRRFPERVTGLVLADTFAQIDTEAGKQIRYQTADRLMREGIEDYANEVLSKMIAPDTITSQPDVAAHVLGMMQTTPPAGAAAALRGRSQRRDYTDLLAQITVPTLIVVGDQDAYTPVPDAEYMHQRISNSTLLVVADAGHMPNLEQPDVFNHALLEFLDALSKREVV